MIQECDALLYQGFQSENIQTLCSYCGHMFSDGGVIYQDPKHNHEHFLAYPMTLKYTTKATKANPEGVIRSVKLEHGVCGKRVL